MIYLDVACNDPDNGLFSGHAEMLQIGNAMFEQWRDGVGPRFIVEEKRIVLSGKSWRVERSKDYVGNWCWNHYLICTHGQTPRWTMTYFLIWLRRRRLFHCTEAYEDFHQWFNDRALTKTPAEIHAMVCEMERT